VIRVLGPIQIVTAEGRVVDLPSVSQRRLLAVLAVHAPGPIRAEHLADVLEMSSSGLRTGVTRLRKTLGDGALVSGGGGYRLSATVDAQQFCRAVATVPSDPGRAQPNTRLATLEAALALWLGPPFDEFAAEEWARAKATRLTELHAAATEDYAEALVAERRCSDAIATLVEHVARHPLRDRARGLMIRALAGAGRQAEALRAYQEYRTMLAEEIGTEPSPEVRRIEQRVARGWNGTPEPSARRPRRASDRYLDVASGDPLRPSWLFDS
jgi:DNA-binding SARP family transcriptional activator